MTTSVSKRALDLVQDALVWDNHACMPVDPHRTDFLPELERHRKSGVNLVCLNVSFDEFPWYHSLKMLATFRTWIKQHPDKYTLVSNIQDIEDAKAAGKLAIAFDIEGGVAVDDLPELVEPYYALGVRWMLIAYNMPNALGGGCYDNTVGLTDFGKRVIDAMEQVGMVLCCSHTSHLTAIEAMEYAHNPVIFSHSNAAAIYQHERNLPDHLITACAETGGVINVNGVGLFLGENDITTETIVRHIDYIANLAGPEHVGLGLDYVFDPSELEEFVKKNPDLFPPEKGYGDGAGFLEPERIPAIADALLTIGWSEQNVRGLLGENNMRVAKQVWK